MAAIPMLSGSRARTLTLLVVLLGAAGFRFAGVNWDAGQHLHPDERFLSMVVTAEGRPDSASAYLDEARSPLNPRNVGFPFFAYGTLPTTVVRLAGEAIGRTDFEGLTLIGRVISATASLGTVLLVFLLAHRLYGDPRIALLAATLLAVAVLPIQNAHFFVVDPHAVFFTTAAAWALAGPPRPYRYPLVGLLFGLALASKASVATFAVVVGTAALADTTPAPRLDAALPHAARRLTRAALRGLVVMAATLAAFRLAQPDAFTGPGLFDVLPSQRWLDDLAITRRLVDGSLDTPPGVQWASRTPYWYAWKTMVTWGLGPSLGLAAWAGWGAAAWQLVAHRADRHLIPVLWTAVLFLHMGGQFAMTGRYLLPIYPMLAVLAAWLLVAIWDRTATTAHPRAGRWQKALAGGLLVLVVLTTGLWAVAFTSIYRRPHTRVEASRWIYGHVLPGATLAGEHWDDSLPLELDGRSPADYPAVTLANYDDDTPAKLDALLDGLDRADYVVLSSNRLSDSIPRLPMRYPMTTRYYEALASGALGFTREAEFTSYPQVGPVRVPDHAAEEAFSVYDHPRVQIFRKSTAWNREQARTLLGAVDWNAIVRVNAVDARWWRDGAMLSPDAWADARAGGTWAQLFDPGSTTNRWPMTTWALLVAALGLIAFPLLRPALRVLPDEGWLLARTAGVLLFGYVVWLLASLRWLPATLSTIGGLLAVFTLASAVAAARQRTALAAWWRERRGLIVAEEALVWVCFVAFVLVRRANPDLWHPYFGGEKPMDVAYLHAVLRSEHFPPFDPWFAGGALNYYYFGFVLTAVLTKMSGIVPEVAYNLAVATFFTLAAAGAFAVVHALATALGVERRRAFGVGVAGLLLTTVAGNLKEVALVGRAVLEQRWQTEPGHTWYWNATRAIPAPPPEQAPITEFPFFTYLYGDLHAHAMALPIALLVMALGLAVVLGCDGRRAVTSRQWPRMAWLALALGALYPLNAWDYPTYAVLVGGCFALGAWLNEGPDRSVSRLAAPAVVATLVVLAGGRLLFWPFFTHYVQAYGSFSIWKGSHTGLVPYLQIHGLFLFFIASAGALAVTRSRVLPSTRAARGALLFAAGLTTLGLGLTGVVEAVVLDGDISRMNTVFKFYFQAWVLLAVAAATGLAVIVQAWCARPVLLGARRIGAWLWATTAFWLLAAAAVYPVLAIRARAADRMSPAAGRTLDGAAFMRTATYQERGVEFALAPDARAIDWLRGHVIGSPVVAEAHLPEYRWGSRVSVHTGLPTIIGWRNHQAQQRTFGPATAVARRQRDVAVLYGTDNDAEAQTVAARYGVEYIYVGPLERIVYPADGLSKFDRPSPYWQTVYDEDGVKILQLRPAVTPTAR